MFLLLRKQSRFESEKFAFFAFAFDSARLENDFVFFKRERLD